MSALRGVASAFIHRILSDAGKHIDVFFDLCPISPSDVVYDLGSGDGRLVFASAQKGAARAVGIELDSKLVDNARKEAAKRHLDDGVSFINSDIVDVDLSEATVILYYLSTAASWALKRKFESELKTGTRVVAEVFAIPGWKPAREMETATGYFYLYVMPPQKIYPDA